MKKITGAKAKCGSVRVFGIATGYGLDGPGMET